MLKRIELYYRFTILSMWGNKKNRDNIFYSIIGCVSKPLYPGPILVIMPGGGGGANVQLNTPPRPMKNFKN